jgi:hypothetical protein
MVEEKDSFEKLKQDPTVWLCIGVPPKENDKQYLLKSLMFEMKFTLYRAAQDLYHSCIYDLFYKKKNLPPPSSLSEQDFLSFLESQPEDGIINNVNRDTMRKSWGYQHQCAGMIDEIKAAEKYQNNSWSISETETYELISKATELIYDVGKFIGYWQRLKERANKTRIGLEIRQENAEEQKEKAISMINEKKFDVKAKEGKSKAILFIISELKISEKTARNYINEAIKRK